MFIQTHQSEIGARQLKINNKQFVLLCKENENFPTEVELNGVIYKPKHDITPTDDLKEKGYTNGKLFQVLDCIIQGCDAAEHFRKVVPESDIVAIATDIWNNTEKYSDYKNGTDDSYYRFLKYLDIEYPDGTTLRLSDVAIKR